MSILKEIHRLLYKIKKSIIIVNTEFTILICKKKLSEATCLDNIYMEFQLSIMLAHGKKAF